MTDRDPTHTLTHGELFSGIGGFSIGAETHGIRTVWSCEKDPHCTTVLRHRFPKVPLFPDVEEMVGLPLRRPDIVSAGSPCQGLSVAGRQRGLDDERSGLFIRFHDLVEQLDPRWAVWENVPGALTSNAGRDFGAVLGWLLGTEDPLPALPKHPNGRRSRYAGYAIGPNGSLAWRVLDAKYLGVPQNRTRIILVVDRESVKAGQVMFGDDFDPADLLAEDPDLSVNSTHVWCVDHRDGHEKMADTGESMRVERPDLADLLDVGVDERFYLSARAAAGILERTDRRRQRTGSRKSIPAVLEAALHMVAGKPIPEGLAVEAAYDLEMRGAVTREVNNAVVSKWFKGSSGPSGDEHHNMVAEVAQYPFPNPAGTLTTRYHKSPNTTLDDGAEVVEAVTFRKSRRAQSTTDPESWVEQDTSNTLNTYDIGDVRATSLAVELPQLRVRRLTPREAERLQGFPDDHTLVDGMKDTPRYKQVGNAIAVPMAAWVMGRIATVHRGS